MPKTGNVWYFVPLKTFLRDKICFGSRFVPRKRFKLPRIIKLCHFVLRKRFRQNQIIAAKDMVTAAPQRSWSAQSLGETVRKVKHSSVRIAKLLQTLCRDFSLARIFGQSAPPRPSARPNLSRKANLQGNADNPDYPHIKNR